MLETRIELFEDRLAPRAAVKTCTDKIIEIYDGHDPQILDAAELVANSCECEDPVSI